MSRVKDLLGQHFGRLTVIEFLGTWSDTEKKSRCAHWKCLCACGNIIVLITNDLFSGKRTTCGCRIGRTRRPNDLTGLRFGRLVVLSYIGRMNNSTIWHCLCDCGNEKDATAHHLCSGSTTSCGCFRQEFCAEYATRGRITKNQQSLARRNASERTCRRCLDPRPIAEFITSTGMIERRCLKCRREEISITSKVRKRKETWTIRQELIAHYGGQCQCCHETEPYFLQLDHINGGGSAERKRLKLYGVKFYEYIIKRGYPEGYRLLCACCNASFGHYGYCPHDGLLHPIKAHEVHKRYFWKRKLTTLQQYGYACQCCKEVFPEFLQIDHVRGGGRRWYKERKTHFYTYLKKRGYPQKSYRILCSNCNCAYGFWGFCPHTGDKKQLQLL